MRYIYCLVACCFLLVSVLITPCQAQDADASYATDNADKITVKATDYAFDAPGEIASGWTNIEYVNSGDEAHFLFFARLPDGITLEDYASNVVTEFNEVWYAIRDEGIGEEEAMERIGGSVPEWFLAVEFMGGTGVIPAGATSDISLDLKPGTYVIECYMKNEDGEMHSMEGMLRELTVTEDASVVAPPAADITVTLSNFEMDIDGSLVPGRHTVGVHVKENPEQGFGHNLHVARLHDALDAEDVLPWMNFFASSGMQTPPPTEFLGGIHLLPAGETGYFKLDLEPGRYLFVSEYTAPLGVWQVVTVKE